MKICVICVICGNAYAISSANPNPGTPHPPLTRLTAGRSPPVNGGDGPLTVSLSVYGEGQTR